MDWNLQYGELANDKEFVAKYENLKKGLMEIDKVLQQLQPLRAQYDKMCLPAQIDLDLFLAYTLNSLHWINMRILGVDPTKHPIKDELKRIKSVMLKWEEVKNRDKRPTVNIEAAKRFIRSGLYDPYRALAQSKDKNKEPPNKKIKFEEDD